MTFNIPHGTLLGIPVQAIHLDDSLYPDSKRFNPFRFTRADSVRDIIDVAACGKAERNSATIDASFLSFGFGKHACPGRFFALNELKLFVAHMVLNYDFEHLKNTKKRTKSVLWLNVPAFLNSTKVRVRKRDLIELL